MPSKRFHGVPIYRGASFLKRGFPGKVHSRELFRPVIDRYGSFGMLYQCVIAFPIPVPQLMQLHFDLDAFRLLPQHRTLHPLRQFLVQAKPPARIPGDGVISIFTL
jgi:hypothetical protein